MTKNKLPEKNFNTVSDEPGKKESLTFSKWLTQFLAMFFQIAQRRPWGK